MKKYFILLPRGAGKSNLAYYEFIKSPNNSLLVLFNSNEVSNMLYVMGREYKKNIISANSLSTKLIGRKLQNIILDEYLMYDDYKSLYNDINGCKIADNIFMFATLNKVYDEKLFNFIKDNKRELSHDYMFCEYCKLYGEIKIELFDEIYYNFLSDPDTIIIDHLLHTIKNPVNFLA